MLSPTFISLCVVEITALALSIFISLNNRRSVINMSFAILLFGLAIIVCGFMFLCLKYRFELFDPVIHYGGLIMLFGLLIFSRVFPSGTSFPRINFFLYIPFIIVAILLPCHLIIEQATFTEGGDVIPKNGPLFIPYAIFWVSYVCVPFRSLVKTYRKVTGKERQQMQYLFAGFIILLISFIIFGLILPIIGVSYLYFMSAIASLVLMFLTVIAIIRHQLLDIRILVQRGLIYLFLLALMVGLYITILQLFAYALHRIADADAIISAGIIMVLGILFFNPLERYFRKATDPIFFKGGYEYAETMHRLSKALHTNVAQTDVVNATSRILESTMKTKNVVFQFVEDGVTPPPFEVVISIPIIYEDRQIGLLILGPKRSGDPYTPTDTQLLDTFAYQAAVALEKGRLYETVEEYNTQLEHLVEKRTLEIKKLQEDQREALIDISHNLQTPLAIIKGEIELLVDMPIHMEKIRNIKRSILHVSLFIRQLLHLSKLDHAAFNVVFEPVDLSKLIFEQIEYFEVMANDKHVRIIHSITPDVVISGNKKLLSELLINMMSNAIKYRRNSTEGSMVTLTLSTSETGVILMISDNGVGIHSDDLPDIFNRFYRGTRKHNTSGTGLGLAICKRIVDKHKGTIIAESIPGKKTAFTVVFPLYRK